MFYFAWERLTEAANLKGIMQRQHAEEREWSLQINYPELFRTASLLPPDFLLPL